MEPWLRFFRVRLLPTALSNLLLGVAVGLPEGAVWRELPGARLLGLASCLYLFGMGLNDYRDRRRDRRLHPDRPLPSGRITSRQALISLIGLLALALGLAATISIPALAWCGAVLLAIVTYDLITKDHLLLGPLAMGCVRLLLVALGAACVSPAGLPLRDTWTVGIVVGGYVALLTFLSMEEEHASPPVLRNRARLVGTWIVLACGLVLATTQPETDGASLLLATLPWLPALIWIFGVALPPVQRAPYRPHVATFRLLLGLFPLDMALLVSYDQMWVAGASGVLWFWVGWGFPFPRTASRKSHDESGASSGTEP